MSARTRPTYVSHSFRVEVLVTSFGYLHGGAPKADVLVDVHDHLRNPPTDPAFRALTGNRAVMVGSAAATFAARLAPTPTSRVHHANRPPNSPARRCC